MRSLTPDGLQFLEDQEGCALRVYRDIAGLPTHRICDLGIGQVAEGRQVFPTMTVLETLEMGALLPSVRPVAKSWIQTPTSAPGTAAMRAEIEDRSAPHACGAGRGESVRVLRLIAAQPTRTDTVQRAGRTRLMGRSYTE